MKVYFTASIVGKRKYLSNYEHIIKCVQKLGHTITADHIIESTPRTISMETEKERREFHDKLITWIRNTDCMIVESTFPSISVGYEISVALRLGKPVLILYSEGEPPSLLNAHRDEKVITGHYNQDNVYEILSDFFNFVQGNNDLRFTFYITPEIALHLDKIAKEQMVPKAVYVRRLIEKDIENLQTS